LLILNADDFGRSKLHTDRILSCFYEGRITSATCMVFMEDSIVAVQSARISNFNLGLHLNFDTPFTGYNVDPVISEALDRITTHFRLGRFYSSIFSFRLRRDFRTIVTSQIEEFRKIYGKNPYHFDGHHHFHLSANVVWDELIPMGMPVRRNFTFKKGEKSVFNILYRRFIDWKISQKHIVTDYFYSLDEILANGKIHEINQLSKTKNVEVMTHPVNDREYQFLMGDDFYKLTREAKCGTFNDLHEENQKNLIKKQLVF